VSLADLKREVKAAQHLSNTAAAVLDSSLYRLPGAQQQPQDWSLAAAPSQGPQLRQGERRLGLLDRKPLGLSPDLDAAVRGTRRTAEERLAVVLVTGVRMRTALFPLLTPPSCPLSARPLPAWASIHSNSPCPLRCFQHPDVYPCCLIH
jgi:hypothetical protein